MWTALVTQVTGTRGRVAVARSTCVQAGMIVFPAQRNCFPVSADGSRRAEVTRTHPRVIGTRLRNALPRVDHGYAQSTEVALVA